MWTGENGKFFPASRLVKIKSCHFFPPTRANKACQGKLVKVKTFSCGRRLTIAQSIAFGAKREDWTQMYLSSQELSLLFEELDEDGDGQVSFDEFLHGLFAAKDSQDAVDGEEWIESVRSEPYESTPYAAHPATPSSRIKVGTWLCLCTWLLGVHVTRCIRDSGMTNPSIAGPQEDEAHCVGVCSKSAWLSIKRWSGWRSALAKIRELTFRALGPSFALTMVMMMKTMVMMMVVMMMVMMVMYDDDGGDGGGWWWWLWWWYVYTVHKLYFNSDLQCS